MFANGRYCVIPVFIITIEGNIAAGKTTILRALQEEKKKNLLLKNVVVDFEPVDKFSKLFGNEDVNPLYHFYQDKKNSYCFQNYVLDVYMERYTELLAQNPDVVVMERGLDACKIFAELNEPYMTELEKKCLDVKFQTMKEAFSPISGTFSAQAVFHINTCVEKCVERCSTRGRGEERNIPKLYFSMLDHKYREYLKTCCEEGVPVKSTQNPSLTKLLEFIQYLNK